MNQNNPIKKSSLDVINKTIVSIWFIFNLIGLFLSIIGLLFVVDVIFLNPIAWICYVIVAIPSAYIIVDLIDIYDSKVWGKSKRLVFMILIQVTIAIIYASLTTINTSPTSILILDFFILFTMFLFMILAVFILIFLLYSYFNEY